MTELELRVCEKLDLLIKKSGLTSKEIAEKLNVDNGTVSRWRNKKTAPSLRNIANLATVLKLDVLDFFTGEETAQSDKILNTIKELEERLNKQEAQNKKLSDMITEYLNLNK